jgi:hypothetical protein
VLEERRFDAPIAVPVKEVAGSVLHLRKELGVRREQVGGPTGTLRRGHDLDVFYQPPATGVGVAGGELATKTDLAEAVSATKMGFARVGARIDALELAFERRLARLERRMFGLVLTLLVPLWAALVAAAVKFVVQL